MPTQTVTPYDAAGRLMAAATGTAAPASGLLVMGSDGTNARNMLVTTTGVQAQMPFVQAVAAGLVSGATAFTVSGFCTTTSTAATVIYATAYTQLLTEAQRSVVSASAADAAAGAGARTIRLTWYTNAWVLKSEIITLNGTTPVNTVATDIRYVVGMDVVTQGTSSPTNNTGIISLKGTTGGGGATVNTIAAGGGRTHYAHKYVPSGKTVYVTSLRLVGSAVNGTVYFKAIDPTVSTPASNYITTLRFGSGNQVMSVNDFDPPIVVVGPRLIQCELYSDSATSSQQHATISGYEM